ESAAARTRSDRPTRRPTRPGWTRVVGDCREDRGGQKEEGGATLTSGAVGGVAAPGDGRSPGRNGRALRAACACCQGVWRGSQHLQNSGRKNLSAKWPNHCSMYTLINSSNSSIELQIFSSPDSKVTLHKTGFTSQYFLPVLFT